jgi:hypothetical protein
MFEPRVFCSNGNHEIFKGSVHGVATMVAALMAAYNIAACCFRRDLHLKINAVLYSLAVGYEVKQTLHHLQACRVEVATPTNDVERDLHVA